MEIKLANKSLLYSTKTFIGKVNLNNKTARNIIRLENISCFVYSRKLNMIVVGCYKGYIKIFNSKTFVCLKLIKASNFEILCMDICENLKIIALLSLSIEVWSLSKFKLINKVKLGSTNPVMKIIKESIYVVGSNRIMQVLDSKKLTHQFKSNNFGYFNDCLLISVTHGLIAYSNGSVHLYNIKTQSEVSNRSFKSSILNLKFVACYILCSTISGNVFYLDCYNLAIIKRLDLKRRYLSYINTSKDMNILVYSSENKSFILDFKKKTNNCILDRYIHIGIFMEKEKQFVFIDSRNLIFIIKRIY